MEQTIMRGLKKLINHFKMGVFAYANISRFPKS